MQHGLSWCPCYGNCFRIWFVFGYHVLCHVVCVSMLISFLLRSCQGATRMCCTVSCWCSTIGSDLFSQKSSRDPPEKKNKKQTRPLLFFLWKKEVSCWHIPRIVRIKISLVDLLSRAFWRFFLFPFFCLVYACALHDLNLGFPTTHANLEPELRGLFLLSSM